MTQDFEHQLDGTRPVAAVRTAYRRSRRPTIFLLGLLIGMLAVAGLFWPSRFNLLVLGIDRTPEGTALGRSDTIMLGTFLPAQPYVGVLSIPRDLWVRIPGYGQNRINAAHFFAESEQPGKGPELAVETVRANFGVDVDGFVRIQFAGLRELVDALGGVTITLDQAVGEFGRGEHLLDGEMALAFVRSREGSDDFVRMVHGQQLFRAVLKRIAQPAVWPRLPLAATAIVRSIDSDIPFWQWPRLAFALLRVGPAGIDGRSIDRTMAGGFVTGGGAQVLAPDWARINPVLMEMFGQ